MSRDEVRKLLGGYAAGTLTLEEQQALFEAALEDQDLFDELAREQPLHDLLGDPAARAYLLTALDEPKPAWHRRMERWIWEHAVGLGAVACFLTVGAYYAWQAREKPVLVADMPRERVDVVEKLPPAAADAAAPPPKSEAPRVQRRAFEAPPQAKPLIAALPPPPVVAPPPPIPSPTLPAAAQAPPAPKPEMAVEVSASAQLITQPDALSALQVRQGVANANMLLPAAGPRADAAGAGSADKAAGARSLYYSAPAGAAVELNGNAPARVADSPARVGGQAAGGMAGVMRAAKQTAASNALFAGVRWQVLRKSSSGAFEEAAEPAAGDTIKLRITANSAGFLYVAEETGARPLLQTRVAPLVAVDTPEFTLTAPGPKVLYGMLARNEQLALNAATLPSFRANVTEAAVGAELKTESPAGEASTYVVNASGGANEAPFVIRIAFR